MPKHFNQGFELLRSELVLGKIDIEFDESMMGGVFNWAIGTMNQKLKVLLENQLNAGLKEFISLFLNKAPKMDQKLMVPVNGWLVLDSTLLSVPLISNSNIRFTIAGEFYNKNEMNNKELDRPVKMKYESDKELIACVSQYSLNTLSLSYFQYSPIVLSSDKLGISINNDMLEALFPGILDKFGTDLEAIIVCKQDKYASFELETESLINSLDFNCELHSTSPILILGLQLSTTTNLFISNNVLHGSFSSLKVSKITLQESHLPNPPDLENLQTFINSILKLGKPLISNKTFGSGIQVPDFIQSLATDLKLDFFKGFLTIEANPIPL